MNPFYRPQITDELLSAYLDGAVTNEEKTQVERAIQQDSTIAWRLESLRQTVNLLRSLPELPLPRSFVLTEADVAPHSKAVPPFVTTARRIQTPLKPTPERRGVWDSLREFLQGGSPLLRNLATTGLAIWLVLFGVTQINPTRTVVVQSPIQTVSMNGEAATVAEALPTTPNQAALKTNGSDSSSAGSSLPLEAAPTETATTLAYSAPAVADAGSQAPATSQEQPMALAAAPPGNTPQEESSQAMGGEQDAFGSARAAENPAAKAMALPPGEDSSPLDQAMGDSGSPSIAAAGIGPNTTDSTPATGEETSPKIMAAGAPAADETANSATEAGSTEEQGASPAAEAPLLQVPIENTPQPTVEEQTNGAVEAAAQPPSTQISEPTPTVATEMYAQEAPTAATQPEVAMAKQPAAANSAGQTTQQRTTESVEEVTSMPLFDPLRMQVAQLLVALVTGVLALFWLGSHMARRG